METTTTTAAITLLLLQAAGLAHSLCYFPAAFQGEYVTQSIPSASYSSLSVLFDSIPVWGVCHRRVGNNVVLRDDTGALTCYKCFNLVLRSSNVLQVHTAGLDMCYATEEAAIKDCPTDISIREKRAREIMLYRTKGFMGEPAVSPTYCPINGAYTFTYSVNDGTESSLECESHSSEIADCPYGFGFNLKFRDCSFGNLDMSFHCLGDWEGADGQRYVALMDTKATAVGRQAEEDARPRYRCALYREDESTGEISLALSSDSSCTNHLRTSADGYETLTLRPRARPTEWPGERCRLPDWAQGKWEHLHVDGDTIVLKDQRNFKTYEARCVSAARQDDEERFLLYARTQCGDEHYKCVWVKNRGSNAMEFQIGLYTSSIHNESLCAEENFLERTWVTQGRTEVNDPTPYPIIGEFTGVIPDTDGLCAKLYSDCNNPEIIFYTIFNCFNRSEVYEEREYRCLGDWVEDGLIYTYTERRDMIGYECFVGLVTAKGDIYLREAGHNCERGQEPLTHGMRLSQVSKCYGSSHHHRWRHKKTKTTTRPRPPPPSPPRRKALPSWTDNNGGSRGQTPLPATLLLTLMTALLTATATAEARPL